MIFLTSKITHLPYFDDIRGVHVMPSRVGILSHIPLHSDSVNRFKLNIHGHLHEKSMYVVSR